MEKPACILSFTGWDSHPLVERDACRGYGLLEPETWVGKASRICMWGGLS